MRPLEVLVFGLARAALVASLPFKKNRTRLSLGLWVGAGTHAVLQALVEKSRWQFRPTYVVIDELFTFMPLCPRDPFEECWS